MGKKNSLVPLRMLIGIMFLALVATKIFYFSSYISLIHFGQFSVYVGVLIMIFEFVGGFFLLINYKLRIASVLLIAVLSGALLLVLIPNYVLQDNLFSLASITQIFLHLIAILVLVNIHISSSK
ncbi:DoxX family membrane protein [Candidatus Pacearchaeota archaeon]|nr:DoxX family membrane protein [Candidatus Pacearchaeota archaeon]